MNRYILVDLKDNVVSSLNKVDTNFNENEIQTSSVSCRDMEDTKEQALEYLYNTRSVLELAVRYEMENYIYNSEGQKYIDLTDEEVKNIIKKGTSNIMNNDCAWHELEDNIGWEVEHLINDLKEKKENEV